MSEILWTELEKIDILRERMGVSYERAHLALEAAQGDLVKALAQVEKEQQQGADKIGRRFLNSAKEQMRCLSRTQLNLNHENKTVLSMSAPLGIALAYTIWRRPTLRIMGLLGAATAAIKNYELKMSPVEEQAVEDDDKYPYDIKTVIIPDEEFPNNGDAEEKS